MARFCVCGCYTQSHIAGVAAQESRNEGRELLHCNYLRSGGCLDARMPRIPDTGRGCARMDAPETGHGAGGRSNGCFGDWIRGGGVFEWMFRGLNTGKSEGRLDLRFQRSKDSPDVSFVFCRERGSFESPREVQHPPRRPVTQTSLQPDGAMEKFAPQAPPQTAPPPKFSQSELMEKSYVYKPLPFRPGGWVATTCALPSQFVCKPIAKCRSQGDVTRAISKPLLGQIQAT